MLYVQEGGATLSRGGGGASSSAAQQNSHTPHLLGRGSCRGGRGGTAAHSLPPGSPPGAGTAAGTSAAAGGSLRPGCLPPPSACAAAYRGRRFVGRRGGIGQLPPPHPPTHTNAAPPPNLYAAPSPPPTCMQYQTPTQMQMRTKTPRPAARPMARFLFSL